MASDHLFPILENERDSEMFGQEGALLTGNIPSEVLEGLRLGRMTALRKPDGGVRGITVGDIIRRLVARTIAKQIAREAEEATAPHQHALNTKAGCECVAHILQTLTDLDPEATIVSIDAVGASRFNIEKRDVGRSSPDGRWRTGPPLRQAILRIPIHCASVKMSWEFRRTLHQGRAEGKGDPLMPLLFSLGQHRALEAIAGRLEEGERLFAYLDDVYVVCSPARVSEVHAILAQELERHAHIRLHLGKTQIWNRGGTVPTGVAELTAAARRVKPDAVVWRGDAQLPVQSQGVRVLGTPIGRPEYVEDFLVRKSSEHDILFTRIPAVEDLQSGWLLLLMCGATRANFWLRTVRPDLTRSFSEHHDASVWQCMVQLMSVDPLELSQTLASLPFRLGGMGLAHAVRGREAAHWASWADCIRMVKQRHPHIAATMMRSLVDTTQ